MTSLGELRGIPKNLPRRIPSGELQTMLRGSPAFCSWDPSNSTVTDVTTRWPFLFSQPLLGTTN